MTTPLLPIGTFGCHLLETSGIWSFAGTIPTAIQRGPYTSEAEALAAFVTWFKAQPLDFQRHHVGDLRTDVFTLMLST